MVASCFFVFSITARTFAFAQGYDGKGHKGQHHQQHYDGGKIHPIIALAMR